MKLGVNNVNGWLTGLLLNSPGSAWWQHSMEALTALLTFLWESTCYVPIQKVSNMDLLVSSPLLVWTSCYTNNGITGDTGRLEAYVTSLPLRKYVGSTYSRYIEQRVKQILSGRLWEGMSANRSGEKLQYHVIRSSNHTSHEPMMLCCIIIMKYAHIQQFRNYAYDWQTQTL